MKHSGIVLKGYRLSKDGQLVRSVKLDVSARLRQRNSKKVRVGKPKAT